VVDIALNMT